MNKFNRIVAVVIVIAALLGCFTGISLSADEYDIYPVAENNSLDGKIVFLDPGHGKGSYNGAGGYLEHEGNLTIALLVKENLERCGATVIMTREDETNIDSYVRMAHVNKVALSEIQKEYIRDLEISIDDAEKAELQGSIDEITELMEVMQSVIDDPELSPKYFNSPWNINTKISSELKRIFEYEEHDRVRENILFLSIHANAGTGTGSNQSANGTVTYYLTNTFGDNIKYYTNYAYVDQSKEFAQLIQDNVVAAGNFRSRGLAVNNFFMIREHNLPAALLEVAFFTNAADRAKLMDEKYQKRIATGVTYAIQEYFEIYSPVIEPVQGDVNGDGIITIKDVVIVARYLVGKEQEIDKSLADLSGDGLVANTDLILIGRIALNMTEE